MFSFSVTGMQCRLQDVRQEDLGPDITLKWLSDHLDKAPSQESIRRYLFRDRGYPLSINAQRMLKSSGESHYKALQTLRGSASHEGQLESIVRSAITDLELAWHEFNNIQQCLYDLNLCLGECEALMNTTCLLLIMFASKRDWATKCMTMMRRGRLNIPGIAPIILEEKFDDADEVGRNLLHFYQRAIEGVLRREKLSMRQNTVKGKEPAREVRARVPKPEIQCEALQVSSRVFNSNELIQPVYSIGAEPLQPVWIPSTASPLLGYGIPSSTCYSPSIYDFSTSSLLSASLVPTSASRNITSKRRLSVDDELEHQRPAQRRKESVSTFPDPTPTSITTIESTVPIFPHFLPPGLTTPQNPDLGTFNCPDYFSWDPEKPPDTATWEVFNVNNISTAFDIIPLGYEEDGAVRPLMAHSSTGDF